MGMDEKWLKGHENGPFWMPIVARLLSAISPRKAVPKGLRNQNTVNAL